MDKIRTQISKSRQCAERLRDSKFPDYGAVACLERNADAMEAMLEVVTEAQAILRVESLRKAGHQFPSLEQALAKLEASVDET